MFICRRTLEQGNYSPLVPREILWYQRDKQSIYYQHTDPEPAAAAAASAVPVPAAAAPVVAAKAGKRCNFEPSEADLAKYGAHMRTLASMGFMNTKRNMRLLQRFAGNLDRTVHELLHKPEKNKPQATA